MVKIVGIVALSVALTANARATQILCNSTGFPREQISLSGGFNIENLSFMAAQISINHTDIDDGEGTGIKNVSPVWLAPNKVTYDFGETDGTYSKHITVMLIDFQDLKIGKPFSIYVNSAGGTKPSSESLVCNISSLQ